MSFVTVYLKFSEKKIPRRGWDVIKLWRFLKLSSHPTRTHGIMLLMLNITHNEYSTSLNFHLNLSILLPMYNFFFKVLRSRQVFLLLKDSTCFLLIKRNEDSSTVDELYQDFIGKF